MGEIVSQTKVFIDFSGVAGILGGAGASKLLKRVKDVKVKDDRKTEIVKAVGVDGGAGFRDKTGGGTITLAVYRDNQPEVDWRGLKISKRRITITLQDENSGVRESFGPCRVSSVDRNDNEEGEHMDEVEIVFLGSDQSGGVAQ